VASKENIPPEQEIIINIVTSLELKLLGHQIYNNDNIHVELNV
jgi:hypothetical protein